jgi:GAF domain-containing protein
MPRPPVPADEKERLQDLYDLNLLDTEPEERFDRFIRIARRTFDVPVAFISLVDVKRQWFKACEGLSVSETSRDISFCAYTILANQPLIVPDAYEDARFANNALVKGPPYIRFYAGYPLRGPRGHRVGSFCIVDFVPRQMDDENIKMFGDLATMVSEEVNHTVGNNAAFRKN